MRSARAFVIFVFAVVAASASPCYSQVHSFDTMSSPSHLERRCGQTPPIPISDLDRGSDSPAISRLESFCGESARSLPLSHTFTDGPETNSNDYVQTELLPLGAPGLEIARARQEVLRILESGDGCAAWYRRFDLNPVETFRSVRYAFDETGPGVTFELQNTANQWYDREPYVASTVQNSGSRAIITLNARGAFFRNRSVVQVIPKDGGPGKIKPARDLDVEIYFGGTLRAQVLTLLHELAHIIGAIPPDGPSHPQQSGINTEMVLKYCRADVESAGRHKNLPQPFVPAPSPTETAQMQRH